MSTTTETPHWRRTSTAFRNKTDLQEQDSTLQAASSGSSRHRVTAAISALKKTTGLSEFSRTKSAFFSEEVLPGNGQVVDLAATVADSGMSTDVPVPTASPKKLSINFGQRAWLRDWRHVTLHGWMARSGRKSGRAEQQKRNGSAAT